MVINKTSNQDDQLKINQKRAETANKYSYPGTTVNEQWNHSQEVKIRIEKARTVFQK